MTGVTDRRFIFTRGPAALGYPTQESPLFERNASGIHGSFVGNPAFGYRHLGRPLLFDYFILNACMHLIIVNFVRCIISKLYFRSEQ